ncbi:MAG: LacI family DNA-binding transcriptional regulator [Bacteroidales bacterium]|nr:LacI family DNA-binding transcriptional regulator [Bacteroidales bacterium]MDT8432130.1 LacI family DNA-binding transcriptional regulator [Bacteroidales bacterium]
MTKDNGKKIGIKDIALKAGVSIGTVDRVLHMRGDVSAATQSRVLAIVEEYGYTPNVIARTLSSKKQLKIGIVIPDSSDRNPYWEMPILGISKAGGELSRFNTGIIEAYFDASVEASFREAFDKVLAQNPDGMVLNPVFGHNSLEEIRQLDEAEIPYVSIEVNVEGIDKLGHFGQDAQQSGRVAASLVAAGVPELSETLIIKQTSKKIFSKHIESRISGFLEYFSESSHKDTSLQVRPVIVEIDLSLKGEPETTLQQTLSQHPDIKAVFIPNSRAFLFADFIEQHNLEGYFVVGYDIIDQNIAHLEKGTIAFLIGHRPHVQAYNAIMALAEHLLSGKEIPAVNYSQIDIINKENITYYKNN